jgi:hypothetical protein
MNPIMWLDDIGKPAWIALMIVSFVLCWPAGFVVLGYMIGSGRMGHWTNDHGERWQRRMERMQRRMQERAARWCGPGGFGGGGGCGPWSGSAWTRGGASRSSSGNTAFDEYRNETLRRLEEEERQFKEFLNRLRQAKDKAEFDQFMAEMRNSRYPEGPAPQPEA